MEWITIDLDKEYEAKEHIFKRIFYVKEDYRCAGSCINCNSTFFGKIHTMVDLNHKVLFTNTLEVGFSCPSTLKVESEDKELVGVGC